MRHLRCCTPAVLALAAMAGCADSGPDGTVGPLGHDLPLLARTTAAAQSCEIVDFNAFTHGDAITTLSLFGGDAVLTVTAYRNDGGAVDATAYDTELWDAAGNPPPNNTHNDTQRNILCNDAANGGTGTCDGVVATVPDEDFANGGDNTQGGGIQLSGFSSDFLWEIPSFAALDDDGTQTIRLFVGSAATLVGASTGLANGSVETVLTTDHAFANEATFTLDGSGGVDDVEICRTGPGVGRMTGGGGQLVVLDEGGVEVRITRGFTIHCDITLSNNLEINWPDNKWHIDKPLTSARCTDEPDVAPEPPPAPFDTFWGEGFGRLNGVDGSFIRFVFQDAGEPGGSADKAGISIWAPGADPDVDEPVLFVPFVFLDHGNLQAHFDQPHGSNVNR